jgi:hypothetical protein
MAEVMTIHQLDDELSAEFDKLIAEVEQWTQEDATKRAQALREGADLAKGKETVINRVLKREIANDLHHTRIVPLTMMEIVVYSGQARIATHKEANELSRT